MARRLAERWRTANDCNSARVDIAPTPVTAGRAVARSRTGYRSGDRVHTRQHQSGGHLDCPGRTKCRTCAQLARHGYVLETGGVALEGEADGLMDNPHVRKAYLGI